MHLFNLTSGGGVSLCGPYSSCAALNGVATRRAGHRPQDQREGRPIRLIVVIIAIMLIVVIVAIILIVVIVAILLIVVIRSPSRSTRRARRPCVRELSRMFRKGG